MIHIITAFTRLENKQLMIDHLKNKNIKWTVIIDKDIKFPKWVNKFRINVESGPKDCYARFNEYLDAVELEDETQYMFLNDDDFVETGFWQKIPTNYDIIFVSMKRGDGQFNNPQRIHRHPTNTLHASREHIYVGNVGLEQYIVKGKILKTHRFEATDVADGTLAVNLLHNDSILFLPNAFVYFNYLEDGRWDEFKR